MDKICKNAFFYYSYSDCAYIEGLETKFNYAAIESCSEAFYNALLERGWRRFGEMFFAPFVIFAVSAFLSATLSMILNSLKITNAFYAMPRTLRLHFKSRVFPLTKSHFIINIIVR